MKLKMIIAIVVCAFTNVKAQTITTFAGGGTGGDGVPATSSTLTNPHFGVFDKFGNFYFSDFSGCKVRKIDASGIITTVAGTGTPGFNGDSILATNAMLMYPEGIACDTFGNIFVADHQNYRIRKIDITSGVITTFAGLGINGDSGDSGLAIHAVFFPSDIHFDKRGNLYLSDNTHSKIRKIDASGVIFPVSGTSSGGCAFAGDEGPAVNASLCVPSQIAIDDTGNIYIADNGNRRIRKIDTLGIIHTIAGSGLTAYNGEDIPSTTANISPLGLAFYGNNLYLTEDNPNQRVRVVDITGTIHTLSGTGIPGYNGDDINATDAQVNNPGGLTNDSCGNIYFSDIGNLRIRKVAINPACWPEEVKTPVRAMKITLYPNPTYNNITITAPVPINNISITNMLGQQVYTSNYSSEKVELDISYLPKGVYTVRVNNTYMQKLVKG